MELLFAQQEANTFPSLKKSGVKVYRFEGSFRKIPFLFKYLGKRYPPLFDGLLTNKLKKIEEMEKPDIIICIWLDFVFLLEFNEKVCNSFHCNSA